MRRTIGLIAATLLGSAVLPGPVAVGAPTCFGRAATIVGTEKKDVLEGTPGNDVIVGLAGGDNVKGKGGDDRICLGPGQTVIYGRSPARSALFCHTGCAGPESAVGGEGHDRIDGGRGDDQIDGGAGRDRLFGGKGDDFAAGGPGADGIILVGEGMGPWAGMARTSCEGAAASICWAALVGPPPAPAAHTRRRPGGGR